MKFLRNTDKTSLRLIRRIGGGGKGPHWIDIGFTWDHWSNTTKTGFTEKTQGKTSEGAGGHVGAARPSDRNHIVSRTHSQRRKPMISRLDSHTQPQILFDRVVFLLSLDCHYVVCVRIA